MDKKTIKKMEALDDFYLVEVIRDQRRFGYNDQTVAAARSVLKKRGRSDAELEAIYAKEVAPQDAVLTKAVRPLFQSFLRLGRFGVILFSISFLFALFFMPYALSPEYAPHSSFLAFLITALALVQATLFVIIPILCITKARRITRLLLDRYDSLSSRKMLSQFDDRIWPLFIWFFLPPGFIYSFYTTKKALKKLLREAGLLE